MDERFARLIRAAQAVRVAYPHGDIGPNQMPPGAEANALMDELEAATLNAVDAEDDVGGPALLDKSEKIQKWMALRDEVGKLFHRYAECEIGSDKITFKGGMVKLDFNEWKMLDTFKAFLAIDEDFIIGEFEPQFWHGHDSACHAIIDILNRALVQGLGGSFGSAGLTEIVAKIIELRNKP